ncbi:hypothetical protein P280DRAFT_32282 [Massarina eburnea CBS 473.64]|uniref:YycE-like N-terminal domain-containing protein n=1 Tax=Massarina eburnea CBS 473.64 TaxID=1395130 RepID=A0A6A6RZ78_9PLEO|nr:hypothetical protein P280DRAFT_32282 [Massarina eburnea CBS 473.64]
MTFRPSSIPLLTSHLRIARLTPSVVTLLPFYATGLGISIISSFSHYNGFNGTVLSHPSLPCHLESTEQINDDGTIQDPSRCPTQDSLLISYLPEEAER